MIPHETVQKILDTARIEEVVADFVSLRKRGAEWWGCCPFHNEKTPSFHVVPAKGIYYCFGCHKGGSAVGFVMEHEHMSYPDALRFLAKKYNIEVVEEEESAEDIAARQRNESLILVSEYAGGFFREQLKSAEGKAVGMRYFHTRGLEDSTIEKYGLGWAPSDKHSFTDAAKEKGFKDEYLLETGLCAKYDDSETLHDRFVERVIFPIHSVSGRVVAFGARTLKSKEEGKPYAKYVNSKESAIYVKNQSLYGIWFAKGEMAKKDKCYLVEGYLDVLSMHQLGITNVVASSGTALTEGQIRLIGRFTRNVTIMYDGDAAGVKAALRGIDMFLRQGMDVKVLLLPDGDDPDSYSRKHSLEEVQGFISANEQDFVDFKSSLLMQDAAGDPLKRAGVINDIADTVADIPDAVKRETYIDFLSQKFDIRRDALEERVSATRSKNLVAERNRSKTTGNRIEEGRQNAGMDVAGDAAGLRPYSAAAQREWTRPGTDGAPAHSCPADIVFPIHPSTTEGPMFTWNDLGRSDLLPVGHQLGEAVLLFSKVEDSVVAAQVAKLTATKAANEAAAKAAAAEEAALKVEPQKAEVTFDDFGRMDIRTATVLEAERVPKTDKLLKLSIDTGIDKRTIVSGIAEYYTPEEMVGKQICILANLQPRVIRGIESKGMILMAKQGDGKMRFITPQEVVSNGSQIN